jgi:hypothetical protein
MQEPHKHPAPISDFLGDETSCFFKRKKEKKGGKLCFF